VSDAPGDCLAQQVSETERKGEGVAKEEEREGENKKKQSRLRGTTVYRKRIFR